MDYNENQDSGYICGVGRTHEGAFWGLVMFLTWVVVYVSVHIVTSHRSVELVLPCVLFNMTVKVSSYT